MVDEQIGRTLPKDVAPAQRLYRGFRVAHVDRVKAVGRAKAVAPQFTQPFPSLRTAKRSAEMPVLKIHFFVEGEGGGDAAQPPGCKPVENKSFSLPFEKRPLRPVLTLLAEG